MDTKTVTVKGIGVSRTSLYYRPKKPPKDWVLKQQIEEVLREHPSYGSRRISIALGMNRKPIKRVMNLFGIKAYRRRGRKWKKTKNIKVEYPNLLLTEYPLYPNHIWVSDFTEFKWKKRKVYLCTIMDLWNREVIGLNVLTNHSILLTTNALLSALHNHPRPEIFHSDNGSEYRSKMFSDILTKLNIKISRSKPGCPWENGYQESFYDKFKIDFGDPERFETLGELVFNIYQAIYTYNHTRIHSALKMSPIQFLQKSLNQNIIKTSSQSV